MATLYDLLAEKAALDKKISDAREREIHEVVAKVRTIVNDFGLQEADVFGGKRAARKAAKRNQRSTRQVPESDHRANLVRTGETSTLDIST